MSPLRLAWLHLARRRLTTTLALVSIAVSVACAGTLLRLYRLTGSRLETLAPAPDAIVGAKAGGVDILLGALHLEGPYPGFLPEKLYESLKSMHSVHFEDGAESHPSYMRRVIPFVWFARWHGLRVIGTEEGFLARHDASSGAPNGASFARGRWASGDDEVVVGAEVAQRRHLDIGSRLDAEPWIGDDTPAGLATEPLSVVGILGATGSVLDRGLFTSIPTSRRVLSRLDLSHHSIWKEDVLHYFLIDLEPRGLEPLEALVNGRTVGQVVSVPAARARLEELTGTGRTLGLAVTVLIIGLSALGVAAMLTTRFESMTVDLAVLRALGFRKAEIAGWLLWEGVLLGVAACLLGAALDAAIFPWLKSELGAAVPSASFATESILQSAPVWGAALAATILAAALPLLSLYRQDVHSALRGL